ncbi:hypothetical protein PFISCL1PPCAC_14258, partial [Pristionchus fissidentatus]
LQIFLSGCVICCMALLTIQRTSALHNSFGIICAFQMASDLGLLVVTTVFSFLPARLTPIDDAPISKFVGLFAEALYFFSGGLHVLFAIHRFIYIVFPTKKFAWGRMTGKVIAFVIFLSLARSFLMPILDTRLFLKYDRYTMCWVIVATPWTYFYVVYFEIAWSLTEFVMILSLDCISLFRLHFHKSRVSAKNSKVSLSVEKLLVKQSFAQCVPTGTVVLFYFFIFPNLTDQFEMFIASSFTWNAGNVLDGLVIIVFHGHNLFYPKSLTQVV